MGHSRPMRSVTPNSIPACQPPALGVPHRPQLEGGGGVGGSGTQNFVYRKWPDQISLL